LNVLAMMALKGFSLTALSLQLRSKFCHNRGKSEPGLIG